MTKRGGWLAAALVGALAAAPGARADVWRVDFNGAGFSASTSITAIPNVAPPDPNPDCGTPGNNACRTDPAGAWRITGISGRFRDANLWIVDAAITGVVPINPTGPRDPVFDPLVPSSLSYIDFLNESPPSLPGLSYNNLFFPGGAPIDCDFPFAGGLLDVFGAAFTIDNGDVVVVWGDGNLDFGPQTYGMAVTDRIDRLDYAFAGVTATVPEPASAGLLALGLAALVGWRRGRR
jgi:hypothetical protein